MHTHSDVLTSERTDLARSERVVYLKPNPLFFPSAVMMLRKTQHRIETASKKLTIDRENARRVSLCVPPPSSLLLSSSAPLCFLLASRADDKGGGKDKTTKIQLPHDFPRRSRAVPCD